MSERKISLAEHLKGFSAVKLHAGMAATALEGDLRRFGPVITTRLNRFSDALNYIMPVKSFTTRFLLLQCGEWSLTLTDMRDANCNVQAYAISRATLCNAIGAFIRDDRRELQVFERGEKVREIQSSDDGGRWYYREEGPLQPFEDIEECSRRRKRDRLSVEAVQRYYESYTQLTVPEWSVAPFDCIYGLERSLEGGRVEIVHFETVYDL